MKVKIEHAIRQPDGLYEIILQDGQRIKDMELLDNGEFYDRRWGVRGEPEEVLVYRHRMEIFEEMMK